jgi:uncharacterized RDD family membrane protein YckC
LSGPGSVLGRTDFRGERLGMPQVGAGALAGFGRRLGAFAIDSVVANLLAGLFTAPHKPGALAVLLAFLAQAAVLLATAGQTLGMRILGMRLVRAHDFGRPSPGWVVVRTVLLALLVPALIWDRDGRGMHDKAAGTALVRTR